MDVRQLALQYWLSTFHKPSWLQFGIVVLEPAASYASAFTLNSIGVRAWSLSVAGSLLKVSSVTLIARIQEIMKVKVKKNNEQI